MGFITKVLNSIGIKTGYMDWNTYAERIKIEEIHAFQQNTRLESVINLPPVGTTEEE